MKQTIIVLIISLAVFYYIFSSPYRMDKIGNYLGMKTPPSKLIQKTLYE